MAYKTISINTDQPVKEELADAAITPGHLLERTTTGVKKHATAGGRAQRLFAVEDENQGKEIDDDYTASSRCFFKNFLPGDMVYALIAEGETITIGDWLVSNGDGELKEAGADSAGLEEDEVGVALEAIDLSGSSLEDPASRRCIVEIR